jgi:hypothetical protein
MPGLEQPVADGLFGQRTKLEHVQLAIGAGSLAGGELGAKPPEQVATYRRTCAHQRCDVAMARRPSSVGGNGAARLIDYVLSAAAMPA